MPFKLTVFIFHDIIEFAGSELRCGLICPHNLRQEEVNL